MKQHAHAIKQQMIPDGKKNQDAETETDQPKQMAVHVVQKLVLRTDGMEKEHFGSQN